MLLDKILYMIRFETRDPCFVYRSVLGKVSASGVSQATYSWSLSTFPALMKKVQIMPMLAMKVALLAVALPAVSV